MRNTLTSTPVRESPRWHGLSREELVRKVETRSEERGQHISALASSALEDMQTVALQDTQEDMGLMLGSRLKGRGKPADADPTFQRDLNLAQLAEQVGGDRLTELVRELDASGEHEQLLTLYGEGAISFCDAALLLSACVARQGVGSKRRKALSGLLDQLLGLEQDWSLTLFAALDPGTLEPHALAGMRQIIRRHHQPQHQESTEGLWHWFNLMRDWPDRRQRVRILLRTFSWELSSGISEIPVERLIPTLMNLKKLLLFLGMEEYARMLARLTAIDEETMLAEIIKVIELRWGYPDWFIERLKHLQVPPERAVLFLLRLRDILRRLPDICFLDEPQRKQLLETIEQVARTVG
ncbi:TyeA family type III secretion system gatekeeper subunit [Citrobacter freundii]|nr:TyeA family type III secretion system gatekeeper subunit [Citrobacter freundii]